jgi:hypothetical protein
MRPHSCPKCEVRIGRIDYKCADGTYSIRELIRTEPPVASAAEWAEWIADAKLLTLVDRAEHPPWAADRIDNSLYERPIAGFGTVWYTFLCLGYGRTLIFLTAACDADNGSSQDLARDAASTLVPLFHDPVCD